MTHSPIGGIGKTVGGIGKTSQPAVIRSLDDERSTRRLKGLKVSPAGLHVERMAHARSLGKMKSRAFRILVVGMEHKYVQRLNFRQLVFLLRRPINKIRRLKNEIRRLKNETRRPKIQSQAFNGGDRG